MESTVVLSLVAALLFAPATSGSVLCINGKCKDLSEPETAPESVPETVPVFRLNLGSLFPFFGPVDFDPDRDSGAANSNAVAPLESSTNDSDSGIVSIKIIKVFSVPELDGDGMDQPMGLQPGRDFGPSLLLQKMFDNMVADMGLLDLSNRNMTSDEVKIALESRKAEGRPVTTLILTNSRVHPMDAGTFGAAENSIEMLFMANASVNLDALRGLTNLKVLNLSMNGLSTFPWYDLMADSLESLDLSHNNFDEVRPELSRLRNLKELDLSYNRIMDVEDSPLSLLTNLEELDLSYNSIVKGDFSSLQNLNQLNLDWNFLRLMGTDVQLPSHSLTLRLASNPWRCDCGLLQARDDNEVLDLDEVQCANSQGYTICEGCPPERRERLPNHNALDAQSLSEMNKESIQHLDCHDMAELYNAIYRLRTEEPAKFAQDMCLFVASVFLVIVALSLLATKCCYRKTANRKFWLRVQQIPHLEKMGKPQEVPYIKIDEPVKA